MIGSSDFAFPHFRQQVLSESDGGKRVAGGEWERTTSDHFKTLGKLSDDGLLP